MSSEKPIEKQAKKKYTIAANICAYIFILVLIFWAIFAYYQAEYELYTNDAQVEEYIVPVNVRISGYIHRIDFEEHQFVKKGDTLAIVDNREFTIQVKQAEAALLAANASRNVSLASATTIHSNLGISDANINASTARLINAEKNYLRYKSLLEEGAATQQQYDQVKSEYLALFSQNRALELQKKTTGLSNNEASRKVTVNDAEVKRLEAALEMAKLNLSYTILTAPYDGITGRRNVQDGQFIQAGQSLCTFIKANQKWVVANFKETQISDLHIGQRMKLKIDALEGKIFDGEVLSISGATGSRYASIPVDNSTGNFVKVRQRIPVKIALLQSGKQPSLLQIRAGMNVEVTKQ